MDHLNINPSTLELITDTDFNEDNEDALSFRDLQMYNQTDTNSNRSSPRTSSSQELFEFFPTLPNSPATNVDIMFCGKLIPGSSSFRLPETEIDLMVPRRSISQRDLGLPRHSIKPSSSVKKVNITTLTSMSSKSRKRMFMFGPVKFMPEMEMSSIRERQGRRIPSQRMFPGVVEDGDAVKLVTHKNQTLTCRARLNSVFERSFACLRP